MVEGDDVAGEEIEIEDPTSEVQQAAGPKCNPIICASNSPCLSNHTPCDGWFHELPTKIGMTNDEGFRMLGMKVGLQMYDLSVTNGELRGVKPGWPTIWGPGLVNKVIKVKGPDGNIYNIKIKTVSSAQYVPLGSGTTPAYELVFTTEGDPDHQAERNVCDQVDELTGEYDTLGQNKWTTVLFEGERYNSKTKKIKGYSTQFFNLGCAGNVLAKMHLTHHSSVSGSALPYKTTDRERQAMMKMYTADYCKDGTSFTVFGEKLGWTDDKSWFPHFFPPATLQFEARWNEQGPICLEAPRLKGSLDPVAVALFPAGVEAAIAAHCPAEMPPTCTSLGQGTDVTKPLEGHLVSGF